MGLLPKKLLGSLSASYQSSHFRPCYYVDEALSSVSWLSYENNHNQDTISTKKISGWGIIFGDFLGSCDALYEWKLFPDVLYFM